VSKSDPSRILIGQAIEQDLGVGTAVHRGEGISVSVFSGTSVVSPGEDSGHVEIVHRILCPLTQNEVRTIRCVGLNVSQARGMRGPQIGSLTLHQYKQHAAEVNMSIPLSPTIFM
jgi:hypothetical protein